MLGSWLLVVGVRWEFQRFGASSPEQQCWSFESGLVDKVIAMKCEDLNLNPKTHVKL